MLRGLALALVAATLALWLAGAARADDPPPYRARAVLVVDGATGEALHARNADRRVAIASITKLMTALVVLEHARPREVVTVAPQAAGIGGSTIYLRAGERITVRDLLAAILVQSANDAAWALAAHVGSGDVAAFVRLMNAKARELGLEDTRFVRPDGLDVRGHYSSARDAFELSRVAMRRPLVRKLVRTRRTAIAGGRRLETWNDLLGSFPGVIGVKTGHTAAAGWSQVAAARRDGLTLYAVMLGSPGRAQRNADLAELLEWGFGRYARVPLVESGRVYATADAPFADSPVALVSRRRAFATVRVDRPLVERAVAPAVLSLPVARGEPLGEVRVYAGRRVVARRALVAAEDVPAPGFAARAAWYAGRAFAHANGMLAGAF